MSDQPVCPKCGAKVTRDYQSSPDALFRYVGWACGSQGRRGLVQPDVTFWKQSDKCRIAELTAERDELAATLAEVPEEIREHARVAAILRKAKENVAPLTDEARKSEDIPLGLWTMRLD